MDYRIILLSAIVIIRLFGNPTTAQAVDSVEVFWNDYYSAQLYWNYSTEGNRACIYKVNRVLFATPVYLGCVQSTNTFMIPATGDTMYIAREGDSFFVREYHNNIPLGDSMLSNKLEKRPSRSRIILPIVVR